MKILILEDETLAAEKLQNLVTEIEPSAEIIGVLKSVEATLLWLEQNDEPDLILSDIQLLDSVSFDIFSEKEVKCPIIFTTAYDQYAIQAFDVNSVDYLLKPIQKEKLEAALEKYKSAKNNLGGISTADIGKIADMIRDHSQEFKSRFLVKLGQKIRAIPVEKIAYFFTEDKMTFIMTEAGEKYPIDHSLEDVDTVLDPRIFFRINRKYIICLDAVKEIHPYFKGRLKLELNPAIDDDDIVISSEKTPSFKQWLDR